MCKTWPGFAVGRALSRLGTSGRSDSIRFVLATSTTTTIGRFLKFCWNSRLWSAVSNTSNCSAASWRRGPFRVPINPICLTVRTSCSGISRASCRGSDSSSRMRTGDQNIPSELKCCDGLLPCDGREVIEEIVQTVASREVVDQVLQRHACANKHGGTAQNLWIAMDNGFAVRHRLSSFPWYTRGRSGRAGV